MEYIIHLAILICIYLILAQSYNLTIGLGRLFNLGHIAVYAIGAYVTALGTTKLNMSFGLCMISSVLISGLLSLLLGAIALRLSGDYFAIGTLAFSSIVTSILINWKSLTNGVLGISGIPRPEIFGVEIYDNMHFLIFAGSISLLSLVVLQIIFNSSFSRILRAQSENRFAAMALGRDIRLINTVAFFTSSLFAGLAGSLYSYYINYVDPSSFSFSEIVFLLSIVIVGSPGSFSGCCASAIFLVLLPEPLRFIEMPSAILGPLRQISHSVILLGAMFLNRKRLFPLKREV